MNVSVESQNREMEGGEGEEDFFQYMLPNAHLKISRNIECNKIK